MRPHAARNRDSALMRLALSLLVLAVAAVGQKSDLEGTLMFLHVWKCGGTSLRELVCDWADREGLACATVASCHNLSLKVMHPLMLPLMHPLKNGSAFLSCTPGS